MLRRYGQRGIGEVLVVDDEASVRELSVRTLRSAGWVTHEAEDGVHALEVLARSHPDVVLLDLMMPRMDGFELLGRLRADPRWRMLRSSC